MATQVINLNNETPAAPANAANVEWQADAPSLDPTVVRNVSAFVPAATPSAIGLVKPDGVTIVVDSSGKLTATASGGGGDTGGLWSGVINNPSVASLALTTPMNQSSTFSVMDVPTGVLIGDSITYNGSFLEGMLKAYPSVPFDLRVLVSLPGAGQNYEGVGFVLASSPSGPLTTYYLIWGNANVFNAIVDNWNSPTSHNSSPLGRTSTFSGLVWVRLVDDGTNLKFYVSPDPIMWTLVYSGSKSSHFLSGSGFNYLGWFFEAGDNAGGIPIQSIMMSWSGA
jgi:hypothetical protein